MNPYLPKAGAWFDLIRIYNLPIPLSGMLAGAYARASEPSWRMLVLLLAALLGCAVTQSFNDYEDREVDSVTAPARPLPSGRLRARSVLLGGHLFALIGAVMSFVVEPMTVVIVLLTFLFTRYYPRAKKYTVLNHLMMPAALALTPLYGSLIVHGEILPVAIFAAATIFLMDINMNVVGSFKDLWDRSTAERVMPVVWGPRAAVVVSLLCGVAAIGVSASAVVLGYVGYGALVPLGFALHLTVFSRMRLLKEPSPKMGYLALQAGRLAECLAFPALIAGVLAFDHGIAVIVGAMLLALYTQTIIPENVMPESSSAVLIDFPKEARAAVRSDAK